MELDPKTQPGSLERLVSTRFQLREEFNKHESMPVTFDRMDEGERWAVRRGGSCLSKNGEWEYEPLPSSRDDAFYARCRFESLDAALAVYDAASANIVLGQQASDPKERK